MITWHKMDKLPHTPGKYLVWLEDGDCGKLWFSAVGWHLTGPYPYPTHWTEINKPEEI
jgi:hypothetical protein